MKKEQEIKLGDLIPQKSSFELMQTKKTYHLDPCTGGKLVEMENILGSIEKMLSLPNAENISKIAMFLMTYEDAKLFTKQTVKFIDVLTGDEKEKDIGGYKLLMNLISGTNEQYAIYAAVLESMGYGRDKSKEIIDRIKEGIDKLTNEKLDKISKKKRKKQS